MNNKLQNYYNMLRESYYEKNGLESTIEFLKYTLDLLEKENEQI